MIRNFFFPTTFSTVGVLCLFLYMFAIKMFHLVVSNVNKKG